MEKKLLIPLGTVGDIPLLYYRAEAERVSMELISFPGGSASPAGGTAYPAVHIAYPSALLPIILSVIELMKNQGRSPQVYFETESVEGHLEVGVLFRALVSKEMLESFSDIKETVVDLFQVEGEHIAELLVTAETELPLAEGEKLLPLFENKFRIIVGITGSMEIPALWEGEVSFYEKEKPTFLPHD